MIVGLDSAQEAYAPTYGSISGLSPTRCPGLLLGAEPALPVFRPYYRVGVIVLSGNMINALSRVDADIAFDNAGFARRTCHHGRE